jgi:hypothetical protein
MAAATNTRWNFEADYIQACNCDYGCPCNFNGYPTHGNCEASWAYSIKNGTFGTTKLDGVTFAQSGWWPKAIHEGNGVGALYIDDKATPEQRKAIEEICSGRHGGGVFEIFPKTYSKVHPTKVTKVEFHYDGANSWFKVPGITEVHSEHVTNPVTGDKFEGEILLPKGIGWKRALVTRINSFWVKDDDILMRHQNSAGFVTTLKFSNDGPA